MLMVNAFWILNSRVDGNDFIKAYVTTLMVPLHGSSATKLWSIINSVAGVHRDYSAYGQMSQSYFIANAYGTLITATQLFVMMGTVALIILLMVTALQQETNRDDLEEGNRARFRNHTDCVADFGITELFHGPTISWHS
ncbi:hypothetical protein OSTOST_17731 [Ostertagia ostertagi]